MGMEPKTPPESNVQMSRTTPFFAPCWSRCGELKFFRCGELGPNLLAELPPLVKLPPKELLSGLLLPMEPLDMGRLPRCALVALGET